MAIYADDLAALLDALGVERAVLCGLSMGGYVAFEFLRRWRARVAALVLVDTRAEPDGAEAKRARDVAAAQAREKGAAAIADAMLPKMLSTASVRDKPGLAERVRALMAATPVAGIVGALGAMRDRPDSTTLLPSLGDVPTLVLAGSDDEITPSAAAAAMAAAIPGARLVEIAGAGHLATLEEPSATTEALRTFLSRLG
jgi:pimeloyl-ACP methyl ester carboxylesterase